MAAATVDPAPNAPPAIVGSRDKSVGWYRPDLGTLSDAARDLLENYSRIAPERVVPHILEVRDLAWQIHPYPCIGQFRFVDLSITKTPSYSQILSRLSESSPTSPPARFLDIGCCFAQDIRKLIHDGARPQNLWGAELLPGFLGMGYRLFCDEGRLGATLLVGDVFDEAGPLAELRGTFDIIQAGLFFHLWDRDGQKRAAKNIVRLLKPEVGILLVGQQVGSSKPGEYPSARGTMFRHDVGSWERFWEEVGEETGSKWVVRAVLDDGLGMEARKAWDDGGTRRLGFEVERVE